MINEIISMLLIVIPVIVGIVIIGILSANAAMDIETEK